MATFEMSYNKTQAGKYYAGRNSVYYKNTQRNYERRENIKYEKNPELYQTQGRLMKEQGKNYTDQNQTKKKQEDENTNDRTKTHADTKTETDPTNSPWVK